MTWVSVLRRFYDDLIPEGYEFGFHETAMTDPSRPDHASQVEYGSPAALTALLTDFEVLEFIGSGGMGRVFDARQLSLNRRVALKVLPSHISVSRDMVRNFEREAEVGGRQHHPGIVAVFSAGNENGIHYIAQELVEGGRTLADELDGFRQGAEERPAGYFREVARKVADVADALHHAHESGVIHRDVKPSNILLTREGKTKVTDFGLAKMENALALSRTGTFTGTPYYTSPEQVSAQDKTIDFRADVFSLGVTLYEMLCLNRPFDGQTALEVLNRIQTLEPESPHKVSPSVPFDLSVISLKAMEKEPKRRYPTMKALAEDLRRYLSGDVILAKPAGPVTRTMRLCKRSPVKSASLGAAIAALTMILAYIFFWSYPQARTRYQKILSLSDVLIAKDLIREEDDLWPAHPDKVSGLKAWLDKAEQLVSRFDLHKQRYDELSALALPMDEQLERMLWEKSFERVAIDTSINCINSTKKKLKDLDSGKPPPWQSGYGSDETSLYREKAERYITLHQEFIELYQTHKMIRRNWVFEKKEIEWEHAQLKELIDLMDDLCNENTGVLKKVKAGLDYAVAIRQRSLIDHESAWRRAQKSIADVKECPQYGGLIIEPQLELVPLGQDTESGLWEFAHLQTGKIPRRGGDGRLIYESDCGIVFVLIPGGRFMQGAEHPDDDHPFGSPNRDPDAWDNEGPIHEVTLKPFFLSKYELTQGQFRYITGSHRLGDIMQYRDQFNHPMPALSWNLCFDFLYRLGLRLPSESEWEFAARAGTSSVYWTGNDKRSLEGAENIADLKFIKDALDAGRGGQQHEDWLDDGFHDTAPVGSLKPNRFGLHDMLGNLIEWCKDDKVYYTDDRLPTDGSAFVNPGKLKVFRGRSFECPAYKTRCAVRDWAGPNRTRRHMGCRPARSLKK